MNATFHFRAIRTIFEKQDAKGLILFKNLPLSRNVLVAPEGAAFCFLRALRAPSSGFGNLLKRVRGLETCSSESGVRKTAQASSGSGKLLKRVRGPEFEQISGARESCSIGKKDLSIFPSLLIELSRFPGPGHLLKVRAPDSLEQFSGPRTRLSRFPGPGAQLV